MEANADLLADIANLNERLIRVVGLFDVLIAELRAYIEQYFRLEADERMRKMTHMRGLLRTMEETLNGARLQ